MSTCWSFTKPSGAKAELHPIKSAIYWVKKKKVFTILYEPSRLHVHFNIWILNAIVPLLHKCSILQSIETSEKKIKK